MVNGDSMIGGTYRGKAEFAELLSRMAEKTARVEAIRAWPANNEVMAADISSPAAGARAVVGATAAAFALTSAEPMSDRSVAAEANNSGTAAR
ncbi:hypothetical protein A4G29_01615 [Mycobacterium kansasii]|nr:hypothetical protein A4G29_01615 [Mycobacterium kansasii]